MKVAITIRLAVPVDTDLSNMHPTLDARLRACKQALGARHFEITNAPDGSVEISAVAGPFETPFPPGKQDQEQDRKLKRERRRK